MNAIDKAIEYFDGKPGRLADAVGVSPSTLSNWRKRGQVAAEKCRCVESATNGVVTRYELRPDVFGESADSEAAA